MMQTLELVHALNECLQEQLRQCDRKVLLQWFIRVQMPDHV